MATEQEIARNKADLLVAVAKRDWESAGGHLAWLVQNLSDSQSIEFFPELLTTLNQAMGENCKESIAFTMRGSINMELGRKQEAILDFNKAVESNPDDSSAYYHRALAAKEIGNIQQAIIDIDKSIRLNPDDIDLYYTRANIKISLDDHQGVINDLDEIIRINPDDANAYGNRGAAKGSLGKHQEAIADFNKAIELNIDDPDIYHNLGINKRSLGLYQEAIECFDKFIALNPKDSYGYVNLGLTKGFLGHHQEAIVDFDTAIKIYPQNTLAYRNRGVAKQLLGDHQGAIADFDMAIRLDPDDFFSYRNRGATKALLGKYRDAVDDFDVAIGLNPIDASTYYYRGSANLELAKETHKGNDEYLKEELDRSNVVDDFRESLRLDPSQMRVKQFEDIMQFIAYLNKNIEFDKEEIYERRISNEKNIKCLFRANYGLAIIPLILVPLFFLIFTLFCIVDIEKTELVIGLLLNYLNGIPAIIYIMSSIALFTPSLFFAIQIYFIHRLEYRAHQSKFPLRELTVDRIPIYKGDDQSAYRISSAEMAKTTAQVIAGSLDSP